MKSMVIINLSTGEVQTNVFTWITLIFLLAPLHNILKAQSVDSLFVPIEIYDSTSFQNWPNYPEIYRFSEVDREPVPLNIDEIFQKIGYPTVYIDAGISLSAVFRMLVDKDGTVIRIVGIRGYEPWLPELGKSLREVMFEPAIRDGKPVDFWINIPIRVCPSIR